MGTLKTVCAEEDLLGPWPTGFCESDFADDVENIIAVHKMLH